MNFIRPMALRPNADHCLLILEVSRSHTTTHHSRKDSSGRVISSSQRPLPDNTQHSQQTDIHAPGRIRSHNPSRRAAVDLRLRPHGHWDQHMNFIGINMHGTTLKITLQYIEVLTVGLLEVRVNSDVTPRRLVNRHYLELRLNV